MLIGTLTAVFFSYRKPRHYIDRAVARVTTIDLDKPIRAGEVRSKADAEELKHEAETSASHCQENHLMALLRDCP